MDSLLVVVSFACLVLAIVMAALWTRETGKCQTANQRAESELQLRETASRRYATEIETLRAEVARLSPYSAIIDAKGVAQQITAEAERLMQAARADAAQVHDRAQSEAAQIVSGAKSEAERYEREAAQHQSVARAMENVIEGYGDRYLMPTESLLDGLAKEFSHKDAGKNLKTARTKTRQLIKEGLAAVSDYAEASRKEAAQHFVLDAFNGKADEILTRVGHDNAGVLKQEMRDAFALVNHGGQPFRNTRITPVYLDARIAELHWASSALELRRQHQEEQKRAREQIREEQKARREYERAIREAEKEEDTIRRAMEKARAAAESASAEQRQRYEFQLAELNARLLEAEEKNRRAISMAQQTKKGHVYVVSNRGSFGESIYKIGLTRRLDPMDRIWELSDSSVPFDFDVHAMILAEDAPALEHALHKKFVINQVNKVNHRKEFFRLNLAEIRTEIDSLGLDAQWTMAAESAEYRETLAIEKLISEDDTARDAWINRQLTLDPVSYRDLDTTNDEEDA